MGGLVGAVDSVRVWWASIRPRKESGAESSPTGAGSPASLFCPDQLVGGGGKGIKKTQGGRPIYPSSPQHFCPPGPKGFPFLWKE